MLAWIRNLLGIREPGHNATAYNCRYWTGDRAGYDLRAVCPACPTEKED